jgi:hypothetical protein
MQRALFFSINPPPFKRGELPLFIHMILDAVGSGKENLFWSYRQDDSGPHKEDDQKKIKLSDKFRVHRISFPLKGANVDCVFFQYGVLKI